MKNSKLYTPNDLIELENHKRYSSIGKMLDSFEAGCTCIWLRIINQILSIIYISGQEITSKMETQSRVLLQFLQFHKRTFIQKYSFENRNSEKGFTKFYLFKPHKANDFRKMHSTIVKICLTQRFKTDYKNKVPGPDQYNNLIKTIGPHFTRAPRRSISKSFKASTPNLIGPGAYDLNKSLDITHESQPSDKMKPIKSIDKNQTYYTKGSIVVQSKTNCITKPCFSIGKESRDVKAGIFKRDMEGIERKIKISMPKF
ncbi:unnamed protein product [Paramecium primaurelia]|uniref:Uncharacterized protein n=1 Tax=Paramecium primaurelia TaxID=5886 RepID=A0A8S1QNK9_PARPR|nr:unnamed protein product [Paramecium primaurelia]